MYIHYIHKKMETRKQIPIRFSDEEAARIRKLAKRQGLGFGTYVRNQMMIICAEEESQE